MVEIRRTITMREVLFSEPGVAAPRPVVRAVGMAVMPNPFAGWFVDDLQPLFEAGATLGERLIPGQAARWAGSLERQGRTRRRQWRDGTQRRLHPPDARASICHSATRQPLLVPSFRHENGVGHRRTPPGRNPGCAGYCRWRTASEPTRHRAHLVTAERGVRE
jgi:hypothetical protein